MLPIQRVYAPARRTRRRRSRPVYKGVNFAPRGRSCSHCCSGWGVNKVFDNTGVRAFLRKLRVAELESSVYTCMVAGFIGHSEFDVKE